MVTRFVYSTEDSRSFKNVIKLKQRRSDIHEHTQHGLVICYDIEKSKVITQFGTTYHIKLLPVLFEVDNEFLLIVLLYLTRPRGTFIDTLDEELTLLPSKYRTVVLGDFNLSQVIEENINILQPILTEFNLRQRLRYATHLECEILDLVLNNRESDPVFWIPLPYSNHFVIVINI